MTRAPLTSRVSKAPERSVVFAVGDIHGRLDLLDGVVAQLRREAAEAAGQGTRLITVFLGDYIDRGPDSAGVIDRLIELRDGGPGEFIFLRGNHEQVLLDLADEQEESTRWLNFGGKETLASYGIQDLGSPTAETLRDMVRQAVPDRHLKFMRATALSACLGDYFFVHAGLRPDRLVEEQSDSDMLWFRYYDDEAPVWDHMVVHGHSPNARPVMGRWRIGVDTEAHASGALTALRLEDEAQSLLRISLNGSGAATVEPWEDVDRSYRRAARERPEPKPEVQAAASAPRDRPKRKPAPQERPRRPAQEKLRRRGRRLMWGTVGALAVVSCTGLMLSASDLMTPPEPAPQARQPVVDSQAMLALREAASAPAAEVALLDVAPPATSPAPSMAAPVEAAPAEAPPGAGPRVQVASVDSEAAANALWARLEQRLPPAPAGQAMRIEPADVDGRTFHRVLVEGFASAGDATAYCAALKEIGQGCLVRAR
jgi:serine/threonine protein phosphatase 1